MRIIQTIIFVASLLGSPLSLANPNYAERSEVKAMVKRLAAKGLDSNAVLTLMSEARRLDTVINAMNRPAERKKWKDYRAIFLKPARILAAKSFYQKHKKTFARAELQLGVPVEVIWRLLALRLTSAGTKGGFGPLMH